MKKIIALLLVAVMSLSLVACGGKEVETSADVPQQEKEENGGLFKTEKEIEITADNWQEYFEFQYGLRDRTVIKKNAFDEIESIEIYGALFFCLKEEYIDNFVSVDIAVEVDSKEADAELLRYNITDDTYEIVPYEENLDDMKFWEIVGNSSNKTSTATITDIRCEVGLYPWSADYEFTLNGDILELYVATLPNAEVIRIQGTLVVKE